VVVYQQNSNFFRHVCLTCRGVLMRSPLLEATGKSVVTHRHAGLELMLNRPPRLSMRSRQQSNATRWDTLHLVDYSRRRRQNSELNQPFAKAQGDPHSLGWRALVRLFLGNSAAGSALADGSAAAPLGSKRLRRGPALAVSSTSTESLGASPSSSAGRKSGNSANFGQCSLSRSSPRLRGVAPGNGNASAGPSLTAVCHQPGRAAAVQFQ
jgi:hypothetical protein